MTPMDKPGYIVIRSRRRTLSLLVDKNGNVVVRAPILASSARIDSFVKANEAFIEKYRKKTDEENSRADSLGAYTKDDIKRFKETALRVFPEAVRHYADLLGVKTGKITVRRQTTRWGSCSASGNISLNILLCDCPENVMMSVIAHEVCHLKVKNHGKSFYELLYKVFPGYNEARAWLNKNGNILQRRYDLYLANVKNA